MKIDFSKYQGTGNDFILIDNRSGSYSGLDEKAVGFLCDRRFGIGADGLILLENSPGKDFYMKYFNSDGRESSMCGNGGRCIAAFAKELKLVNGSAEFSAIDGPHSAVIGSQHPSVIKLKMADVKGCEKINGDFFLNTGSPHYVVFVKDVMEVDVREEARRIRYNDRFRTHGTNVNFVQQISSGIFVRSYERGVEDETLSCGTGVTASVLAAVAAGFLQPEAGQCDVKSMGGNLRVYFRAKDGGFSDIWLEGVATHVYSGTIEINNKI